MWSMVILRNVIFLILCKQMCQHLEDAYSPVSRDFPNEKCMMLQNHAWVTETLKLQDRPMDFNVTEYKKFTGSKCTSSVYCIECSPPQVSFHHHIFDPLYCFLPPSTHFSSGNHQTVVCVYYFVCLSYLFVALSFISYI